jgi:large subunit ribosomal protein L6
MSRIGKQPVEIPSGVEVKIDGRKVELKGPKGTLVVDVPRGIKIESAEGVVTVAPVTERKSLIPFWGLSRALIANAVRGVTDGFEKVLEFQGVGYRASGQGNKIELNLGFSHPINYEAPEGITFKVEKNVITISGIDKQTVGEVAAQIRKLRPPEPYKGAGIRYQGERVRRKAGKKAATTA